MKQRYRSHLAYVKTVVPKERLLIWNLKGQSKILVQIPRYNWKILKLKKNWGFVILGFCNLRVYSSSFNILRKINEKLTQTVGHR